MPGRRGQTCVSLTPRPIALISPSCFMRCNSGIASDATWATTACVAVPVIIAVAIVNKDGIQAGNAKPLQAVLDAAPHAARRIIPVLVERRDIDIAVLFARRHLQFRRQDAADLARNGEFARAAVSGAIRRGDARSGHVHSAARYRSFGSRRQTPPATGRRHPGPARAETGCRAAPRPIQDECRSSLARKSGMDLTSCATAHTGPVVNDARKIPMLQGISPLLSPDLLHLLASMGHGDEVVLVDANFPTALDGCRSKPSAGDMFGRRYPDHAASDSVCCFRSTRPSPSRPPSWYSTKGRSAISGRRRLEAAAEWGSAG